MLAENTDHVYWFMDLEQVKMIYINPAFERIWGLPTNEIYRNPRLWQDSIHHEDRTRVQHELNDWYEGIREEYDSEYRIVRPDGGILWISDRGTVIGRLFGKPSQVCGIAKDITERKQAAETLHCANERLELAQRAAGAGVWDWNFASGHLEWSQELFELLGIDPHEDQASFDKWREILHPDDRSIAFSRIDDAIREGSTLDSEYRVLLPDGTVRWINALGRTVCSSRGQPLRMVGICIDVTRRREMEESLRLSEERYRNLVDLAPDALLVNHNNRIMLVNQAAMNLFGVESADQLVGKSPFELIHPDYHGLAQERIKAHMAGRASPSMEQKIVRLDGSAVEVEVNSAPLPMEKGIATQVILHDITDRKRAEKALTVAKEQAEAANLAKSEFLSNMSHEIRTPMNGIMSGIQLLEYTELGEEQREYLNAIRISANSLLYLINDVLDLSKAESGKIVLEKKNFSLRDSINDVITTQISLIDSKGLNIQIDISDDVPDSLIGDQLRLRQILLNLLGNAIKFTHHGVVRISVIVKNRQSERVLLKIGIADTGIGISVQTLQKIFDPFVQADASTTRKYGGTGLGLSICKRLTDVMRGKIWGESVEGVGSTFYLEIPFAVSEAVVERPDRTCSAKARPLWDGPAVRILLVEDMEINLKLMNRLLRRHGLSVAEAHNGLEALDKLEEGIFDAIVMDIHMPEMSGIEVMRAIRAKEEKTGKHIPAIAVTGRAFLEERDDILSQGFDGYVAKPIEIGKLLKELSRCLISST